VFVATEPRVVVKVHMMAC